MSREATRCMIIISAARSAGTRARRQSRAGRRRLFYISPLVPFSLMSSQICVQKTCWCALPPTRGNAPAASRNAASDLRTCCAWCTAVWHQKARRQQCAPAGSRVSDLRHVSRGCAAPRDLLTNVVSDHEPLTSRNITGIATLHCVQAAAAVASLRCDQSASTAQRISPRADRA